MCFRPPSEEKGARVCSEFRMICEDPEAKVCEECGRALTPLASKKPVVPAGTPAPPPA